MEVFECDDVIHHLLVLGLRMTLGYSIAFRSFVYTFPYGRAKTIQIRYVWTRVSFLTTQQKNLSFPNYGIRVDRA